MIEGVAVAVVGGLVVAVIAGDGTRFAGQDTGNAPTQKPPEAPTTPLGPTGGVDTDETEGATSAATLQDLALEQLTVRAGTVAGRSVPPSPHFGLRGSQCSGSAATYTARTASEFSEVSLVAALDDTSPPDSRVSVEVFGDGQLLDEAVVAHRTAGTSVSAQIDGIEELSIQMTALTPSDGCRTDELHLLAMDGVVR